MFKVLPSLLRTLSVDGVRREYSLCCPPRPPPGKCGGGSRIAPPSDCRPGPVPPNPCVPRFHQGHETWKKHRNIALFIMFPLIIAQAIHALVGHEHHPKGDCRDYEYMRIRSKRFPWGDGKDSLFHNPKVNHSPGECVPPDLDCD